MGDVQQGQQDVHEMFKQFQSSEAHLLHSLTSQHPSQLLTTCTASKTCSVKTYSVKILHLVSSGTHSTALCAVKDCHIQLHCCPTRPGPGPRAQQHLLASNLCTEQVLAQALIQDMSLYNKSLGRPPAGVHAPSCQARRMK